MRTKYSEGVGVGVIGQGTLRRSLGRRRRSGVTQEK